MAVRQAQRRGEQIPAELQAACERAEQALYVNVRNLFGGRLRQAVTGAAPIAPGFLEFFYACGVPVMEGYGMTETPGVASVNTPEAFRLGSVGRPLPGVEVRIADDDEILTKGPNIFNGYYHDANATREALVDGWLHTGDLGRLDQDGFLHITGRQKDIIITTGARTSRPRTSSTRWAQPLDLAGRRDRRQSPLPSGADHARPRRGANGRASTNLKLDELHRSEPMRAEIQTAIDEANSHYAPVEQIKRFEIRSEDFSQPTGELTPTLKVKRSIAQQKYAQTIDAIYTARTTASPPSRLANPPSGRVVHG